MGLSVFLGDWFSLAVMAGLIAALVAVGVATHHISIAEGLQRYLETMLVSAAIVIVSVGATRVRARIQEAMEKQTDDPISTQLRDGI
ncbi:peptidase E [Paraburkholderia sp. GAS206C]|uniref:hypothetical protein n=1 Tax=unclassified Paraburkholderia TaxID=2615204 RepID=UPI003D25090E